MSQDTETNTINNDRFLKYIKEKKYKELAQLTFPYLKSENKIIHHIAHNFNVLLVFALNPSNNPIVLFLSEAIEHVIEHFTNHLIKLLNNKINIQTDENDVNYLFLDDIIRLLNEQLILKKKSEAIKDFLLKI